MSVIITYNIEILSTVMLKGLVHDWGQCLFKKIIWHEILIEFLQKDNSQFFFILINFFFILFFFQCRE